MKDTYYIYDIERYRNLIGPIANDFHFPFNITPNVIGGSSGFFQSWQYLAPARMRDIFQKDLDRILDAKQIPKFQG